MNTAQSKTGGFLALALLLGLIVWAVTRKPQQALFKVGDRVALIANTTARGTVSSATFGVSGVKAWFYLVAWDSGASPSLLEERFLILEAAL